jgi:hypothetical protein
MAESRNGIKLTSDEIGLLIAYRSERGLMAERRNSVLARAIAAAGQRGSGRGAGGVQGIEREYHRGRRDAMRELYESGGLTASQLGVEVLYLLPDEFVDIYSWVFHRALRVGDQAISGAQEGKGSVGKARGNDGKGTVLGSDSAMGRRGHGESKGGPGGGRELTPVIGNEKALAMKTFMDKELVKIGREVRMMGMARDDSELERAGMRCKGRGGRGCGRYMQARWNYCPECGARKGGGD